MVKFDAIWFPAVELPIAISSPLSVSVLAELADTFVKVDFPTAATATFSTSPFIVSVPPVVARTVPLTRSLPPDNAFDT